MGIIKRGERYREQAAEGGENGIKGRRIKQHLVL
jgi:hypothetical protein